MFLPVDIENKEFSKSTIGGYNKAEVDEFLEQISKDYETLYKENGSLNDKVKILEEKLDSYKNIENSMQEALVVAQKTADDVKVNADEKAQIIIDRATQKSREIIDNANIELEKIKLQYEHTQREYDMFKSKMIAAFAAQMKALQSDN